MTMQTAPDFKLTAKQIEARELFKNDVTNTMLYGGSRSTKTFTLVRLIILRALIAPKSRHAVLRFRFSHVKNSIVYDTFPKVMDLCFPDVPYNLNKSDWFVKFPNDSEIWFGGLDDKERTEKILGNEYVTILLNECSQISYDSYLTVITRLAQKCHYERNGERLQMRLKMLFDENPPTRGHWSYKMFIEGKDPESGRDLPDKEDYQSLLMNPADNAENLPAKYLRALQIMPKRKRDRFWLGKFGEESENPLWTTDIMERSKVTEVPEMVRVVVAVDPSGASDDPEQTNDAIGIIVAGVGTDGLGYLLEDCTITAGPATWGKVVASAYERHKADRVVGEGNYGGAMVEFVIRTANVNISYKQVTASRGKVLRAEPASALHETGQIKMVGDFPDLEDELLNATTTGYTGAKSPNRMDAFVFAFAELFPAITREKQEQVVINVPKLQRLRR